MKLPPKPRTPPIVTRALMAMSLGIPACGGNAPVIPSRIGPPPCENYSGMDGRVVDIEGREVPNVEVALMMNGQTRVYKTDALGGFDVVGAGGVGPVSAMVPGHKVERVDVRDGTCYGPATLTVRILGSGESAKQGVMIPE